jgi:hypothetical protein
VILGRWKDESEGGRNRMISYHAKARDHARTTAYRKPRSKHRGYEQHRSLLTTSECPSTSPVDNLLLRERCDCYATAIDNTLNASMNGFSARRPEAFVPWLRCR